MTADQPEEPVFLSLESAFEAIAGLPLHDRLEALLVAGGCRFHEPGLVALPAVRCVGVGGLPVTCVDPLHLGGVPFPAASLATAFHAMRGLGGMLTYLNPKDRTPAQMADVLEDVGHGSTRHLAVLNIAVLGLSSAVEHEFATQRDLVHLARLTVARTGAQRDPPLVVLAPEDLDLYRQARDCTRGLRSQAARRGRDADESLNNLFPSAKASAVVLTGSLRNLDKLVGQAEDPGKEREYRALLRLLRAVITRVEGR